MNAEAAAVGWFGNCTPPDSTLLPVRCAARGLFKGLQTGSRQGDVENTILFGPALDFPPEQKASPGETGSKAGKQEEIVLGDLFGFHSF